MGSQPYKVPQNIDIEDKVIGPLTLKQFIYLMVGFGILMVIRYSLPSSLSFLFMPISVILGGFFLAMAFYKPGDRDFEIYLASVLSTITKPKKRVWKKLPLKARQETDNNIQNEEIAEKNIKSEDLERLAFIVDSGGFEEELKNKGFVTAMQERTNINESRDLVDTISASENPNEEITGMLTQAKEKIKGSRKELSVQELASISPNQKYEYETLPGTANQKEFKTLLELSKQKQQDRFKKAKVEN